MADNAVSFIKAFLSFSYIILSSVFYFSVGLLAAILGGVFGFVVVVLLIVFCLCWFSPKCPLNNYRRRRRQMQNMAAAPPPAVFPQWPPGIN